MTEKSAGVEQPHYRIAIRAPCGKPTPAQKGDEKRHVVRLFDAKVTAIL
jgi:hypothetical protein